MSIAYVAVLDWSSLLPRGGVQTIDVSDAARPQGVGYLRLPFGAFDVQLSGWYAFIAGGEAGVYVADLSAPATPRLVGHLDTPGSAQRVTLVGDQVYVADGAGGLVVARVLW